VPLRIEAFGAHLRRNLQLGRAVHIEVFDQLPDALQRRIGPGGRAPHEQYAKLVLTDPSDEVALAKAAEQDLRNLDQGALGGDANSCSECANRVDNANTRPPIWRKPRKFETPVRASLVARFIATNSDSIRRPSSRNVARSSPEIVRGRRSMRHSETNAIGTSNTLRARRRDHPRWAYFARLNTRILRPWAREQRRTTEEPWTTSRECNAHSDASDACASAACATAALQKPS
jgi:hypothetical protein